VNFISGLNNLCPHQRAWVTPVNCLLSCVICNDGWIVCPTLRFLLVAELFAQLCEFFLFWPQLCGFYSLASIICVPITDADHLWIVCSAVWFVMMAELFAQLWDFYWWLNCLLNFASFFILASALWILFLTSVICVPIREHGSHLWIVCSALWFLLVAELFAQLCEFFLFWASTLWILFLASVICVPIREHGSHLWIVCSAVWFVMMAELFAQLWDFFLMAELFAQLCEFFYSGLSSVNFIPWPQ
jgi:hypothetical protein